MAETYPPLSELDLEQFNVMTRQEGHTIEGQIKRLGMVEPLIRQRVELREKERRRELAAQRKGDREIDAIIQREFQIPRFEYIKVDGHVAAVVVEKSSMSPRVRADYTVMVPAHVDTIVPTWSSYKPENQNADIDPETGRISSVGVWDEGQACLNAVSIMADLQVPEGMRVYAAFVRGEECPQSVGAKALIAEWSAIEHVDLVLSNEIGPLPQEAMPAEGDQAMRYVVARPGRARMFAKFEVTDDARGHGSIANLANAQTERDRFQVWMEDIFCGEDAHGFRYGTIPGSDVPQPNLIRSHPLLGEERIDTGEMWKPWDGRMSPEEYVRLLGKDTSYMNPDEIHSKFYVRMVPPSTPTTMLMKLMEIHKHIGEMRGWANKGIKSKLAIFQGEESYPPFAMPSKEKNVAVKIAHEMMQKVTGVEPLPVRGESVADENLYFEQLHDQLSAERGYVPQDDVFEGTNKAVLSIPPNGNHAHSPHEWGSADDFARVRHVMMRLLGDPDGYAQLVGKRT